MDRGGHLTNYRRAGRHARRDGVLVAAIGIGAALGPLVLLRRINDPRRTLFIFGAYAVRAMVDLVLAAALVACRLSTSTGKVTFSSPVQSRVPDELRGRAFVGFDVIWQTGRILSLLGGGLLADAVGIRAVYLLGGLLLLTAAATSATTAGKPTQSR